MALIKEQRRELTHSYRSTLREFNGSFQVRVGTWSAEADSYSLFEHVNAKDNYNSWTEFSAIPSDLQRVQRIRG